METLKLLFYVLVCLLLSDYTITRPQQKEIVSPDVFTFEPHLPLKSQL